MVEINVVIPGSKGYVDWGISRMLSPLGLKLTRSCDFSEPWIFGSIFLDCAD